MRHQENIQYLWDIVQNRNLPIMTIKEVQAKGMENKVQKLPWGISQIQREKREAFETPKRK